MSEFNFSQFKNSGVVSPTSAPTAVPEIPEASPALVPEEKWADDSITYVTVTQDRLSNNRRNMPVVMPHVDRVVVVDGFSKDGTFEYLQSLGSKVQVFQREWDDSFANQYNEYLRHIKGGWVLILDDDELPSEQMASVLREVVKQSEGGTKFDTVEFRANDISYVEGEWENHLDNGPCEYYRQMFFKWNPNLRYDIHLHQSLQGLRGPAAKLKAHYYHIKSTKDELRNACRNYFISGEWPPTPVREGYKTAEWHEMKAILTKKHPEVKVFGHMNSLIVSNQICQEIKDWAAKYAHHNEGVEGESAGELRCYQRYFDLVGL